MIGLAVTSFTQVRLTVGPSGARIALGLFGWPRSTVPLSEITEVKVDDVHPMRYGGWGYRITSGVRGYIVRSGPGIRIERADAPAIVVTVDDADRGAAVLAGHLERTTRAGVNGSV